MKRGYGGIRDIEFAVQLLQLVHGRHDPSIRARATLDALEQLADGGYVTRRRRARSSTTRTCGCAPSSTGCSSSTSTRPTRCPTDAEARTHLARVLGFRDRPERVGARRSSTREHQRHQAVVRSIHEKLFFAPLLDTLAGVGALSIEAARGAARPRSASATSSRRAPRCASSPPGLTRRSRVMQQLLPAMLGWLSDAPDPDLGLLAAAPAHRGLQPRSSTLARRFRETPVAAERTCRILGSSRVLGLALYRQPEFVDALADDDDARRRADARAS